MVCRKKDAETLHSVRPISPMLKDLITNLRILSYNNNNTLFYEVVMIIHVVAQGDTIQSIAEEYGVNAERLIADNNIVNPGNLAVGQTILIVYPNQVHTVQEGDTLSGIAESYGVSVMQLLRNNPFLADREFIYPGESIIIDYTDEKAGNITTNGYAYPYIDRDILKKNLPYLTYLSIFNYSATAAGDLNAIDDEEIVNLAKAYGVAPVMVLSNVTEEGLINREMLHGILASQEVRLNLTENILNVLKTKGYYGLNVDLPYIMAEDRQLFFDFISALTERIRSEGFKVFVTINPNSFEAGTEIPPQPADYSVFAQITDGIILLSYTWGYLTEIPFEAIPLYILELLLEYALIRIPPEKITIGISSIGYIWELPYIQGASRANSISNANAIQLASDVGAEINYNPGNLSSYFYVTDDDENYLVYFHDVRGVDTSLDIVAEYGLQGVGIWNVMYYLAQTFLLINARFNIVNVI